MICAVARGSCRACGLKAPATTAVEDYAELHCLSNFSFLRGASMEDSDEHFAETMRGRFSGVCGAVFRGLHVVEQGAGER